MTETSEVSLNISDAVQGYKGGPGSGNFEHAGRPGKRGGSQPQKGTRPANIDISELDALRSLPDGYLTQDTTIRGSDTRGIRIGRAMGKIGDANRIASALLSEGIDRARADSVEHYYEWVPKSAMVWATATDEVRGNVKKEIINNLVKRTGVDPFVVGAIVKQWSESSNKSLASVSLQQAAAEEFGLEFSGFQQEQLKEGLEGESKLRSSGKYQSVLETEIDANTKLRDSDRRMYESVNKGITSGKLPKAYLKEPYYAELKKSAYLSKEDIRKKSEMIARVSFNGDLALTDRPTERKVLRAMYEATQFKLKEAGITELTLYRGANTGAKSHDGDLTGKIINYRGNALESFSAIPGVAKNFASGAKQIIALKVPASKIFCFSRTGFGCLTEGEFVVMGNSNVQAQVIWDSRYEKVVRKEIQELSLNLITAMKGGPGSGNHGHAGRPGKKGGSSPNKGGIGKASPLQPVTGDLSILTSQHPIRLMLNSMLGGDFHTDDDITLKKRVAYSMQSGLGWSYGECRDFIAQWATSANDDHPDSLAIQVAASEVLGCQLSQWQKEKVEENIKKYENPTFVADQKKRYENAKTLYTEILGRMAEYQKVGWAGITFPEILEKKELRAWGKMVLKKDIFAEQLGQDDIIALAEKKAEAWKWEDETRKVGIFSPPQAQKAVKWMYDNTQRQLRQNLIKPDDLITVYRGIEPPDSMIKKLGGAFPGDTIRYSGNAIESWSFSFRSAQEFGGLVVAAQVRASDIVSIPGTGFGCYGEAEVVIRGGSPSARVTVAQNNFLREVQDE